MKKLIVEAIEFWSMIAKENGWSMEGKGVTVWVDKNMKKVDSLYNPTPSDSSYIVDHETDTLIKEIKH